MIGTFLTRSTCYEPFCVARVLIFQNGSKLLKSVSTFGPQIFNKPFVEHEIEFSNLLIVFAINDCEPLKSCCKAWIYVFFDIVSVSKHGETKNWDSVYISVYINVECCICGVCVSDSFYGAYQCHMDRFDIFLGSRFVSKMSFLEWESFFLESGLEVWACFWRSKMLVERSCIFFEDQKMKYWYRNV